MDAIGEDNGLPPTLPPTLTPHPVADGERAVNAVRNETPP